MNDQQGEQGRAVWDGKRSERVIVRCTPAEKEDIANAANRRGKLSLSAYVLQLHHAQQGRL